MVPNILVINSVQLSWRLNSSVKQLKQSFVALSITVDVGRFANESFRQRSIRKRVGSIRKRPIVSSQTSHITRTLYCFQG